MQLKATYSFHVAADTVQAGTGDLVLFASGSSARQTEKTTGKAYRLCDHCGCGSGKS